MFVLIRGWRRKVLRSSGHEILSEKVQNGRILLFVDESGTSGKPLSNLEENFMVICGVEIASRNYENIRMLMKEKLSSISSDVHEFHTTEIFNPKKQSPWREATFEERKDSLLFLKGLFCDFCIRAPFLYITGDQYHALIRGTDAEGLSQKEGIKRVFFNRIFQNKKIVNENYAVIYDSEKNLQDEIKIQCVSLNAGSMYEDGIIIVDSKNSLGLQIADFAVYILNRMHHSVQRMKDSNDNGLDRVILESLIDMKDKYFKLI
jgi:hypothetical protein